MPSAPQGRTRPGEGKAIHHAQNDSTIYPCTARQAATQYLF